MGVEFGKENLVNQPDLGLKVAELRQQKQLTQQRLAELCEVSLRTIQRIESGEVDPRAYTVHCLGTALDFDFGEQNTAHESLWLAALHVSSVFNIVFIPLMLWLWKRDRSYRIDQEGRQVLNFQITMTLVMFTGLFLLLVGQPVVFVAMLALEGVTQQPGWELLWVVLASLDIIGIFLFVAIAFYCLFQGSMNTIRSLTAKPIHYELSIPFVR